MGLLNRRSPISPKALTWRELRRLRPGTELIYFNWEANEKTKVVLLRALMSWRFGDPPGKTLPYVQLRYPDGSVELEHAMNWGASPLYDDKSWHDSHVLVLPEDVGTLPTKPHWRNQRS